MKRSTRSMALALALAIGLPAALPGVAEAGSKGKRNTAIGLGALAVYGIATKKPLVAGLAAGGAIYSYMKSQEAAKKDRARQVARARAAHARAAHARARAAHARAIRARQAPYPAPRRSAATTRTIGAQTARR